MTVAIDDLSLVNPGNTSFGQAFECLAKTALILGIFYGAMKVLESYLGISSDQSPLLIESNDNDNSFEFNRYKPIEGIQTNSQTTDLVSFATENVMETAATLREEKKEELEQEAQQFVIGAEDLVDHINRMIG